MKKIFTLLSIALMAVVLTSSFGKKYNSGVAGYTGSPGEQTCSGGGGCHSGGASGSQTINIVSSPTFSNNEYIPGTTYNVSVTISGAGASFAKFGFGCEVLNTSNANTGTLQTAGSGVAFANSGAKRNAIHTSGKLGTGGATFTFQWKAPAAGEGDATFYYCGNAVNNNGNTSGDLPIPGSLTLTEGVVVIPTGIKETAASQTPFSVSVFPNPATDYISVAYELVKSNTVSAELYDINGRLVKVLMNEHQNAGNQEKTISLSNTESGVYFLRLNVNGNKVSQKLITVK